MAIGSDFCANAGSEKVTTNKIVENIFFVIKLIQFNPHIPDEHPPDMLGSVLQLPDSQTEFPVEKPEALNEENNF